MRPAKQTILEVLSRGIPRRGLPPVCYRASSELPRWPHNIRTGTRATYVRRLSGCFAIKSREGHRNVLLLLQPHVSAFAERPGGKGGQGRKQQQKVRMCER